MLNSEIPDNTLVSRIKAESSNSEAALKELVSRHSGLYFQMVHRYIPNDAWNDGSISIDREHVMGSCLFVMYEAAKKYDSTKGMKFSSFFGSWTRWFLLNQINKSKNPQLKGSLFLDTMLESVSNEGLGEFMDSETLQMVFNKIEQLGDKRTYKIFKMRYIDPKGNKLTPWDQINEYIPNSRNPDKHVSVQRCIDLHNKMIPKIKTKLENELEFK